MFESDLYIIRVFPCVKIMKKKKKKKKKTLWHSFYNHSSLHPQNIFFMENQKCNLMAIGMHNPHIVILT